MKDEGIVSVKNTIQYRNPINVSSEKEELPELNDEQRIACDSISEAIEKNKHETYLIHGITGSGKTRVYIELIKEVVAKGKPVSYTHLDVYKRQFAGNLIYLSVNRPLSKDVKWKFITAYISIVLLLSVSYTHLNTRTHLEHDG